ncbi:hypothetical protein D3C83_30560 [compost metagenome]
MHFGIAELGIAQARHRVVLVEPMLRLGRGLDVPFVERPVERFGHFDREHGLAGARFALDQERSLERDRGIHRHHQIVGRDVGVGSSESAHVCLR